MRGIDVSSYNGSINWDKVKENGIDFAIIKAIRKDLNADKRFLENWNGCMKSNVSIAGVYNYSYATTEEKARTDAKSLLKILSGKKCTIWLDVEDNCQKNLGTKLIAIINAYAKVIKDAGYDFGVYTGLSFYNSYIKKYGGIKHKLWIARYGKNNGFLDVKYQPQIKDMVGWQYTSKGIVPGISGYVDLNVWYGDLDTNDISDQSSKYSEPTRLLYKKFPMQYGSDVKWVQEKLFNNGFLEEKEIDGWFGSKTDRATRLFQLAKKIASDGKVGVITRNYLKM